MNLKISSIALVLGFVSAFAVLFFTPIPPLLSTTLQGQITM